MKIKSGLGIMVGMALVNVDKKIFESYRKLQNLSIIPSSSSKRENYQEPVKRLYDVQQKTYQTKRRNMTRF